MSMISANEWKTALTAILNKLDTSQYDKMLVLLEIPKQRKTAKFREQMPQRIIEHHGLETSISKIKNAMDQIPRKDEEVQNLLLPFVEQLKNEQKTKGKKRKCGETDSKAADKRPQVGQQRSGQPYRTAYGGRVKLEKTTIVNRDPQLESSAAAGMSTAASASTLQVQSAPVQTRRIEIKSITTFNKLKVQVVADVKNETFFVTTQKLAEVLGFKMEAGVEHRIYQALPVSAEAKMQGNQITEIKKVLNK